MSDRDRVLALLHRWERLESIQNEIEQEQLEAHAEAFVYALLIAVMIGILLLYWKAAHG